MLCAADDIFEHRHIAFVMHVVGRGKTAEAVIRHEARDGSYSIKLSVYCTVTCGCAHVQLLWHACGNRVELFLPQSATCRSIGSRGASGAEKILKTAIATNSMLHASPAP